MNERHVINVKVERKQERTGLSFRGLVLSFLLIKHPHVHSYSMEILLRQFFLVNRTCFRLIRDLTQIKLLTTLMTEIYDCRAFPTARTAKHNSNNSFPLENIKLLLPTPLSFSARAHFWCFNLQQLVLKICNNFILFAARFFNFFKKLQIKICSMSLVVHRRHIYPKFNIAWAKILFFVLAFKIIGSFKVTWHSFKCWGCMATKPLVWR